MLYNDPKTFREDMLDGYVSAFSEYIMQVPGGVVRATETPKGKVAVINGGGSGHYPAFCGIIGEGFMDGTVVGNIFTSPSTDDVLHVARAVENGSGVFIVGGNYAGDKMNFNLARDILCREGIDARSFYITDDIASAVPEEIEKRRGNVGTFTVFKVAGASAAEGLPFDEIVRLTSLANDRVRTMSVGFKGCTMPGAKEPMFHVPEGKMEVGQGIHGEPGVFESDLLSAAEIAELLVDRILAEAPADDSKRIGVILDGLGSTKYEELFVVWKTVSALLKEKGYTLVEPLVGEFVTSLDMAGIALSIVFLNDELEHFWKASADTPAFRKGSTKGLAGERRQLKEETESAHFDQGSEASKAAAALLLEGLRRMKAAISEAEPELARIDSVAGDGDHGRGMVKGTTFALEAAQEAQEAGAGLGSTLKAAGRAWAAKAGGTSGVLWGEALCAAGEKLGDDADAYTASDVAAALREAGDTMMRLGKAKAGDKTMLDSLLPFTERFAELAEAGMALRGAWQEAVKTAEKAAQDTADLLPKVGRARPQAERSLGTPDAGAVSLSLCLKEMLH